MGNLDTKANSTKSQKLKENNLHNNPVSKYNSNSNDLYNDSELKLSKNNSVSTSNNKVISDLPILSELPNNIDAGKKLSYDVKENPLEKILKNKKEDLEIRERSNSLIESNEFNPENISKINLKGSLNKDIRLYYKFKDSVGGGNFGTVRIAYRRNEEPRKYFAIKSIKKAELSLDNIKNLTKEVKILSDLDHPNIIKFYETYNDDQYFHIVMELCKGKALFERLLKEGTLPELKVANIIYKLLRAISYCHSQGITHRDLKPDNILFLSKENDSEIKLIDFGLSRYYNGQEKMHTVLGSTFFVAPEVLKAEYDMKCDIWSIGAITYNMISGTPPFTGNTNHIIFEKIIHEELVFLPEIWKNVSKEAIDFINKCMIKNPEMRFGALEAIEHPWFDNINNKIHTFSTEEKNILEKLKIYQEPSTFKKMVYQFLLPLISSNENKKLEAAFNAIDINNEGFICINDLEKAFAKADIQISKPELENIIKNVGSEEKFDYSDFLVAAINQNEFQHKEKLVSAFKYFDVDNSGFICCRDIKNVLLRSGREEIKNKEIENILSEVLCNGTKKEISFEEFMKIFSS